MALLKVQESYNLLSSFCYLSLVRRFLVQLLPPYALFFLFLFLNSDLDRSSIYHSCCSVLSLPFLLQLGFEEASTYVMYGAGAFFAGWILSAVVTALDSIPLVSFA